MFSKAVLPAACLAALSSPAFAQGFTGGDLRIDAFTYSEGDSFGAVNYSGGLSFLS